MTGLLHNKTSSGLKKPPHNLKTDYTILNMNSLQVISQRKQRQRAAWAGIACSNINRVLLLLAAVAVVLLMPAGAGTIVAAVPGSLSEVHTGIVFTLALYAVVYSVLKRIKEIVAGIKKLLEDARDKAVALFFALAADYITLSMTASACALSSRACAAQSRTRARHLVCGRILSSVRDLFARTVAHLRDATSTLRAAGIRP